MIAQSQRLAPFRSALITACQNHYGKRLVSLALFGSWARAAATPVSDLDLLVIAEPLPTGRMARLREFEPIEDATLNARLALWPNHPHAPPLSPLIKTPKEVLAGSPLFLDMTDWCDLLFDPHHFLSHFLAHLKQRLTETGAQRLPRKGGYVWDYKPSIRPHEEISL